MGLFSGSKNQDEIYIPPPSTTTQMQGSAATPDSTNNQHSLDGTTQPVNPNTITPRSSSLRDISAVHDFAGATIELQVNDVVFKVLESRVSKFISLNQLIENARSANSQNHTTSILVHGDSGLASDFFNAFELLNASLVDSIDFNSEILVSAARISAAYDYSKLHALCIKQLEGLSLGSIERFQIGHALGLKAWEERACQELCERDEMITREEMLALGVDAYFEIVSMREKRYRGITVPPQPVKPPTSMATATRPGEPYKIESSDDEMGFGLLFD
ncbi:unnamed protein product [Rhizoctonia solani]|uniref:BTB domain-containing protein n=1 Tax=Rhizoctonia solani TaxID=456999 RepID=A0A8H3BTU5_9AGAM|nr:unnamed protein product [Rhizoctonia solani]